MVHDFPPESMLYDRVDREASVSLRLTYIELDVTLDAPLVREMMDDARTTPYYDTSWASKRDQMPYWIMVVR